MVLDVGDAADGPALDGRGLGGGAPQADGFTKRIEAHVERERIGNVRHPAVHVGPVFH